MRKYSTPPWRVDWDTNIASVKAANGIAVARCYQGDDDAVLIAAAPALLSKLKELADYVRCEFASSEPLCQRAEEALALVAQAAINNTTK